MLSSRKLFGFQLKKRCQPSEKVCQQAERKKLKKHLNRSKKWISSGWKKNVSSDRNKSVIWSKNKYQSVENICQPIENLQQQIEKMCLQIEKIVINQSKKWSQQNENQKVLTERKKVSYDRNEKFGLLGLFCSENSQPIEFFFFDRMIRYFDSLTLRLAGTSTRKHFDPKTFRLDGYHPLYYLTHFLLKTF